LYCGILLRAQVWTVLHVSWSWHKTASTKVECIFEHQQKLEETRTIVDSEGNQQTIVSRTINGQTVRQTTRKNKSGETEVSEDLINMDESKY